jgi:hypothetical protein
MLSEVVGSEETEPVASPDAVVTVKSVLSTPVTASLNVTV